MDPDPLTGRWRQRTKGGYKTKKTILLVEQNLKQALEVADRGYVVETGRVALRGSRAELLNDPAVRAVYLGI